jgi:hypothetical protein
MATVAKLQSQRLIERSAFLFHSGPVVRSEQAPGGGAAAYSGIHTVTVVPFSFSLWMDR